MIDYIHAATYIGVISILVFLIPMILSDIKIRRIDNWIVWLLIVINLPALYVLYSNGLPLFYLLLSIAMTLLFGVLCKMGAFKGGDVKVLGLIAWCCPLNPLNPNDAFFQIQYVIFLAGCSILWMVYVYFTNRSSLDPLGFDEMTIWQKFNNYPSGSPWMIPIAIAFVITVVLG